MSRGVCPKPLEARAGCPVAERPGGCFRDRDHIVPQRYAKLGWLVQWYIKSPDNLRDDCRWNHEIKNANSDVTESIDLIPDEMTMLDAVTRAVESGYFHFNTRNQRRYEAVRQSLSEQPLEGAAA